MKTKKILDILAYSLIAIFVIGAIFGLVMGFIHSPTETLFGLAIGGFFLMLAWAAYRIGKIQAEKEFKSKK